MTLTSISSRFSIFSQAKFLFVFVLLLNLQSLSQKEAQNWYFGFGAGLSFSTSPPTILTNGIINTYEGCATISDAAGNLLFYTDGITVYNKTHVMMANGNALMGNGSSTQSGIIVKQPGNNNIYFVFTQADVATINGFRYSVVDMALAAGLGSVTVKNTLLQTPSCEKITAVRHCNGTDVWVISHDYNSDTFRTYLVNASGVAATPVLSAVGTIITGTGNEETLGQMKISPNGRKLGMVTYNSSAQRQAEVFDFDAATGMVSNQLILGFAQSFYGCEFSPDGSKFYGAVFSGGKIFQWDLCAGTTTAVIASIYTINITGPLNIGSLQLGPDGQIYVSRNSPTLSLITNPNAAGSACNFIDIGQSVAPKNSGLGLPNFINSYFKSTPAPFTYSLMCSSASFTPPAATSSTFSGCNALSGSITATSWNFGDPSTGAANSSSLTTPTHIYSSPGQYTAQLVLQKQCTSDTIKVPITVSGNAPIITVTGVMTICEGDQRYYTASGATSYTWSTNSSSVTIALAPTVTTVYYVSGTSSTTCKDTKTFTITVAKCSGISEANDPSNLKIYPNPFNNMLHVDTEAAAEITIKDQVGSTVYKSSVNKGNTTLDLSFLPAGIYTASYRGKTTRQIRLVKME